MSSKSRKELEKYLVYDKIMECSKRESGYVLRVGRQKEINIFQITVIIIRFSGRNHLS